MVNFVRISSGADVGALMLALAHKPHLWNRHSEFFTHPNNPYRDADSIVLRFPERLTFERANLASIFDWRESVTYPAYPLLPEARQLVMAIMAKVAGERLGRVTIHRIPPGKRMHAGAVDPDHALYYSQFILVLHSDPGVLFRCGDEWESLETGSLFCFANDLEHELENDGNTECIYLSVDIRLAR